MLYYNNCKGETPRCYLIGGSKMSYDIYFNGELVSTELSFMGAMMYINGHNLFVVKEEEYIDIGDPYVILYCVEA